MYAYWFTGVWLDIGDKEQLLAADNMLRRAQGLPERDEYALESWVGGLRRFDRGGNRHALRLPRGSP